MFCIELGSALLCEIIMLSSVKNLLASVESKVGF